MIALSRNSGTAFVSKVSGALSGAKLSGAKFHYGTALDSSKPAISQSRRQPSAHRFPRQCARPWKAVFCPHGFDDLTVLSVRTLASRRYAARAALGRPGPWHQFVDARGRPEIDELGDHVGEVSLRIDAIQFAGFDERSNAGPVLRPLIVAREQRIFPIENNWADACVRNRPVSRIPVALHAQEAEVGLRVILFSRRLGRLHCSQWFLRLCELSVKFAVAHRSDQYVDDHGKLVERRNDDCVLALFELNRFRSQPNKEDIGPVRVNPPPGQDALHLIDRRELTVLLHPSAHGPSVVSVVQQKLLLLQTRYHACPTTQCWIRTNLGQHREGQSF